MDRTLVLRPADKRALATFNGTGGNDILVGGAGDEVHDGGTGDWVVLGGVALDTLNNGVEFLLCWPGGGAPPPAGRPRH